MKGRRPKPTHLKLISGNPGRRPLNSKEPQPDRKRPRAPKHITDNARKAWRHVTRLLDHMGVLTEADGVAVEALCEAYADLLNARAELKAFGSNYYKTTGKDGGVMHRVHPAVAVMQDADRRLKSWLAEFGLTASSRTRVRVEIPERTRTTADKYLNGPTVDRFFRR